MTDVLDRVPDHQVDRRAFLAAGAAAAVLAGNRTSLAQGQPPNAPAATIQGMPDTVQVDRLDGSILLIGIDLRGSQNRIDPSTFIGLGRAYHLLDHDQALRVGVLYAQGPDFVSGIDPATWEPVLRAGRFDPGTRAFIDPVGTVPPRREKPLVVAVQGKTQLVGHELFLAADVRIAASDAVFGQGEVTRGHFPAGGGTIRFVREAGWGNAMRYMLTGEHWSAQDAYRMGTLQEIADTQQGALDRAVAIANRIAACAPLGVRTTLESAHLAIDSVEEGAFSQLAAQYGALFRTHDFVEGLTAAKEKRAPIYRGN